MRIVYTSFFSLVLFLCLSAPASGQFIVDDLNAGFFRGTQVYGPTDPLSNYASLANTTGNPVFWDFTQYGYELERDFFVDAEEVDATTTRYPRASTFVNLGANTVEVAEIDGNIVYDYARVTDAEIRYVGSVTESTDGTVDVQYDPGRLDYDLPFTYEDSWSSTSTQTVGGFPLGTVTKSVEVVGYGTVATPVGQFLALQLESEITVGGTTTRQVEWVSERLLDFSAVISFDENDNVEDVELVFFEDAGDRFRMGPGSQGSFIDSDNGYRIAVTQAPSTEGTLGLARYDRIPEGSTFIGSSAQSNDGSTITPDVVWDGFYVSLTSIGLEGFEVDACFRIETIDRSPDVTGIGDVDQLVVVRRGGPGDPWEALDTTVDDTTPSETKLCVRGLTSFSQFAIGGEQATNPLPVELTGFGAETDGSSVLLTWSTASETNNAGFAVEQRTQEGPWRRVGFVEGAGTTTAARAYRFRRGDVGFGRHDFRLRQIDRDGTSSLSRVRSVTIVPEGDVVVTASPNPLPAGAVSRLEVTPRQGQAVTVDVVDLLGRRVDVLFEGPMRAGETQVLSFPAHRRPSGLYFVRVRGETVRAVRKITVLR
jgi:hypothetical protein